MNVIIEVLTRSSGVEKVFLENTTWSLVEDKIENIFNFGLKCGKTNNGEIVVYPVSEIVRITARDTILEQNEVLKPSRQSMDEIIKNAGPQPLGNFSANIEAPEGWEETPRDDHPTQWRKK